MEGDGVSVRVRVSEWCVSLAEAVQGGVIEIYKLEDGSSQPLMVVSQPEWWEVKIVPGWVRGLTTEGKLETMAWSPW